MSDRYMHDQHMHDQHHEKRVLMLLAEGFELIETACFTDVLAWASFQDRVDITLTSASRTGQVRSAFGGFSVATDVSISELNLADYHGLAIPGGMEWAGFFDDALADEFSAVIQHFAVHNKPIAAVCVAATSIANAGELTGKNATIYHSVTGKHKANLEGLGAVFVDLPVVRDGNITTSTGPGTAVEVALALLGDLTDVATVDATRKMMRIPQPQASWYEPQV